MFGLIERAKDETREIIEEWKDKWEKIRGKTENGWCVFVVFVLTRGSGF